MSRQGVATGHLVVSLHGSPGSRHTAVPSEEVLKDLGLCLVTFDRPGYGTSTRAAGRRVVDTAGDVIAIADLLGAETFTVVGGSGGAPMALACGAIAPSRIHNVVNVVPPAPIEIMGAKAYFEGMDPSTSQLLRLALENEEALRRSLTAVLGDADFLDGLVDDLLAVHRPWGFDLSRVEAPVDVWYGTKDVNAPPQHALFLAEHLRDVTLHPQAGDHAWPAAQLHKIFERISNRL